MVAQGTRKNGEREGAAARGEPGLGGWGRAMGRLRVLEAGEDIAIGLRLGHEFFVRAYGCYAPAPQHNDLVCPPNLR